MKKLIIDRFEGNYALCEEGGENIVKIPKYKIPPDCREGACLIQDEDGMIMKDCETTVNREKRFINKMNRILAK